MIPFLSAVIVLIVYIVFCYKAARNRRIGFWWALFFCITLYFIGGIILTLFSPEVTENRRFKEDEEIKEVGLILGLIAGVFVMISLIVNNSLDNIFSYDEGHSVFYELLALIQMKIFYVGLCGLGIYIWKLGEGKRWGVISVNSTKMQKGLEATKHLTYKSSVPQKRNNRRKILLATIVLIVFLLAFTNPSNSDFNYYLKGKGYVDTHGGRTGYFLLFSLYNSTSDESEIEYLGIFKNFIILSKKDAPHDESPENL